MCFTFFVITTLRPTLNSKALVSQNVCAVLRGAEDCFRRDVDEDRSPERGGGGEGGAELRLAFTGPKPISNMSYVVCQEGTRTSTRCLKSVSKRAPSRGTRRGARYVNVMESVHHVTSLCLRRGPKLLLRLGRVHTIATKLRQQSAQTATMVQCLSCAGYRVSDQSKHILSLTPVGREKKCIHIVYLTKASRYYCR